MLISNYTFPEDITQQLHFEFITIFERIFIQIL